MTHALDISIAIQCQLNAEAQPIDNADIDERLARAFGACSYLLAMAVSRKATDRKYAKLEVERLLEMNFKSQRGN